VFVRHRGWGEERGESECRSRASPQVLGELHANELASANPANRLQNASARHYVTVRASAATMVVALQPHGDGAAGPCGYAPRGMRFPTPAFLPTALAITCSCLAPVAAQAQALPAGVHLGMTVPELRHAVPALRPVPHPARLAGGLVGRWAGPPVRVAGVALTPTFFIAGGRLARVEYVAPASGFDALLEWGRRKWGPELAQRSPEGTYASWARDDVDAYLQQAAQVRLVIKRRVVKDASTL
jgi:hypothetical protein